MYGVTVEGFIPATLRGPGTKPKNLEGCWVIYRVGGSISVQSSEGRNADREVPWEWLGSRGQWENKGGYLET